MIYHRVRVHDVKQTKDVNGDVLQEDVELVSAEFVDVKLSGNVKITDPAWFGTYVKNQKLLMTLISVEDVEGP